VLQKSAENRKKTYSKMLLIQIRNNLPTEPALSILKKYDGAEFALKYLLM